MRARFLLLTAAVFAGVLVAPASALPSSVRSIDAPWIHFYADGSSSKQIFKDPIPRTYAVDKSLVKSSFKVDFTTTPAIYQPAINAAVDIWSQNFTSQVPVSPEGLEPRALSVAVVEVGHYEVLPQACTRFVAILFVPSHLAQCLITRLALQASVR